MTGRNARTFPGGPIHAVEWDDVSTGTTLCGSRVYSYDIRTSAGPTCVVCNQLTAAAESIPEAVEDDD